MKYMGQTSVWRLMLHFFTLLCATKYYRDVRPNLSRHGSTHYCTLLHAAIAAVQAKKTLRPVLSAVGCVLVDDVEALLVAEVPTNPSRCSAE